MPGANQNSRLSTHKNTNLILKTSEWMIYKALSLYIIICIFFLHQLLFLFWDSFENCCFLVWGFMFVLLCSLKTGSVFPTFCHATFHLALNMCCNVSQAGYNCWNVSQSTFDFSQGHQWLRIYQWQSLFSWVKV